MKRLFDFTMACGLALILAVPLLLVALAVRLTSRGPILYWSDRVGRDNRIFRMPKFRSMRIDTPEVASHLLDSRKWLTPIGQFLRSSSLDELPQLWCILKGDMSFVGPRPALFNQHDLIEMRTKCGVHKLAPGLTVWAQILGRDEFSSAEKTAADAWYAAHRSLRLDLEIILRTALNVVHRDGTQAVVAAAKARDNQRAA